MQKRKAYTKHQLFQDGVFDLARHVSRAVDKTRQDHPLREIQDLCRGLEELMIAAMAAAELGHSLELICMYQPLLPGMDGEIDPERSDPDTDYGLPPEFPF